MLEGMAVIYCHAERGLGCRFVGLECKCESQQQRLVARASEDKHSTEEGKKERALKCGTCRSCSGDSGVQTPPAGPVPTFLQFDTRVRAICHEHG